MFSKLNFTKPLMYFQKAFAIALLGFSSTFLLAHKYVGILKMVNKFPKKSDFIILWLMFAILLHDKKHLNRLSNQLDGFFVQLTPPKLD